MLTSLKLVAKINGILLSFFLFALLVILLTLYVARQTEGGAAAINDTGSERMRTYALALRLHQVLDGTLPRETAIAEAHNIIEQFEATLVRLEEGDPERPLFLPKEAPVQEKVRKLRYEWDHHIKPRAGKLLTSHDNAEGRTLLSVLDASVQRYVAEINELVLMVEQSNARHTRVMFILQNVLVGFSLLGTILLIYLSHSVIIRPVEALRAGIERMTASDFDVRLDVMSQDEFGQLAAGFNRMAGHLQYFYATLEERVREKTRSVEEKNRELALLYEITAYLSEPAPPEAVCKGILLRLCELTGAPGGCVHLVNAVTGEAERIISHNLACDPEKVEAMLPMLTRPVGDTAVRTTTEASDPMLLPANLILLTNWSQDDYAAVAAVPIRSKDHVLGTLSLFFRDARTLVSDELRPLAAIGQHLGVAIENHRLAVREKEMAVSEERNLLAQELHDSIAQSLAFLNIQAQLLQESLRIGQIDTASTELEQIREGIQESYDNIRELLVHFRIKVDDAEFEDAVRSALERFEGQTGISTELSKTGDATFPAAVSTIQVLHIVQEALSNVRKHARATKVHITLSGGDGEFRLSICDDGKGFDPASVVETGGSHVGIDIMRERAHRIGAALSVKSTPGSGACVTLSLVK